MRTPLICTLVLALLAGAATAAGAQSRYVGFNGFSEGPVTGAPDVSYVLRTSYIAPGSWKAAKAKRDAITRRFGPVGSCKFRVTVTARAVADADETASARVARLLPASGRFLHDEGTRNRAAWRVTRGTGSKTITGLLVRAAPSVRTQPQGKRVWLELIAVGTVDPKVECHAGGPRSIAAAFGDLLAVGSLGGFQPR
ncbi:MAG: hypothetical protein QOJ63_3473 [Solirubrobacteraceae bacterium]|jgi:hypothetical protein|nr:hypothetical protein [Solirubrobacteraceae bacterium]